MDLLLTAVSFYLVGGFVFAWFDFDDNIWDDYPDIWIGTIFWIPITIVRIWKIFKMSKK